MDDMDVPKVPTCAAIGEDNVDENLKIHSSVLTTEHVVGFKLHLACEDGCVLVPSYEYVHWYHHCNNTSRLSLSYCVYELVRVRIPIVQVEFQARTLLALCALTCEHCDPPTVIDAERMYCVLTTLIPSPPSRLHRPPYRQQTTGMVLTA